MNKTLWLLVLFLYSTSLLAQVSDTDEYQFLLKEASVFLHYKPAAASGAALVDSAKYYAKQNDFLLASVFLEEFLEQQATPSFPAQQRKDPLQNRISFTVSSGVDYNRQEFELNFIESDSVIADEIKKPFGAIDISALLSGTEENGILLQAGLRADKENTSSQIHLLALQQKNTFGYRFDAGFMYDNNRTYPDFTYSEMNSRQTAHWKISPAWSLRADNELRYKKYKTPSQTTPDFFKNNLRAVSDYYAADGNLISLSYLADFNESIDYSNNDYFEQSVGINGSKIMAGGSGLQYALTARTKRFVYAMDDSVLANRAQSLNLQLEADIVLTSVLHWKTDYDGIYKHYLKQSEQDPDYQLHTLSNTVQFVLFRNFNFSAGGLFEYKKHFLYPGAEAVYIEEQNYTGAGLLLGLEYYRYQGILFSLEAGYSRRHSPDAVSDSWSSINNNRSVLNFNLLLQIPFADQFNFNLYASYDNDRDLDSDAGNTRSSIFSAEIQYKF